MMKIKIFNKQRTSISAEAPEGDWMCVDCRTVKGHALMATWIPDIFTTEGLPTGSCEKCAGDEQAQIYKEAEIIINY